MEVIYKADLQYSVCWSTKLSSSEIPELHLPLYTRTQLVTKESARLFPRTRQETLWHDIWLQEMYGQGDEVILRWVPIFAHPNQSWHYLYSFTTSKSPHAASLNLTSQFVSPSSRLEEEFVSSPAMLFLSQYQTQVKFPTLPPARQMRSNSSWEVQSLIKALPLIAQGTCSSSRQFSTICSWFQSLSKLSLLRSGVGWATRQAAFNLTYYNSWNHPIAVSWSHKAYWSAEGIILARVEVIIWSSERLKRFT